MVEPVVSFEDFSNICRLCLKKDELVPIFSSPECLLNFKNITKIRVTINDKLPKHVCTDCVEKLKYINCFIENSRKNDAILKTIVYQEEDNHALKDLEAKLTPEDCESELSVEEISVKVENSDQNSEEDLVSLSIFKNGKQTNDTVSPKKEIGKGKIFSCSECQETFVSSVSYKRHIKSHHQSPAKKRNDKCKCIYCSKYFTRKSDLQRHLRIHTGVKLFNCTSCNKKFTQKNSLDRHNLLHTGKYRCTICKQPFTRESHLENHMKTHDVKIDELDPSNPLKCTYCKVTFSSKRYLKGHIRMHTGEGNFVCDICDRTFPFKTALERHHLGHTQIKAFKCDKCDAAFNRNMLLQRHKKVHDENSEEKRRLTCNECGKYFLFPSHLKRHAAVHDPNQRAQIHKSGSRVKTPGRFLCSYCGKKFSQVSNLRVHLRTHTGERFHCDICGNTYSTKDSLKTHLFAHRGEKPYPCPYCGKQFRKPSLYKHLLIHKNVRRFKCQTCWKTFIRKDQLNQHLKIHS